jgi:hypothetical protein
MSDSGQTLRLPLKSTPGSPLTGEIYMNAGSLQWRDNAGSPANHTAVDTGRTITAGTGLTGGGDLSANRTLALSSPVAVANGGTGITTTAGNGKLLIGTNAGGYTCANLTQGSGVTITNGDGTITIAASGGVSNSEPFITYSSVQGTLPASLSLSLNTTGSGVISSTTSSLFKIAAQLHLATINSNVTLTVNSIHVVDASGGSLSLTLPDAGGGDNQFRPFYVYRVDNSANTVTLNTQGGDTINGAASVVLPGTNQYKTYGYMCIGGGVIIKLTE